MCPERYIESQNLSLAWGRAVQLVSRPGWKEVAPLIVSITGFDPKGHFGEDAGIRKELDALLQNRRSETVETVANTIFPIALWNPEVPRNHLFDRFNRIAPRIHRASRANSRGTYFERMIANGTDGRENQLDFIIRTYRSRAGVRRSVLQVAIFDPKRDHTPAARLGFPCLQHVTFAPTKDGLSVNAFYAAQYMLKRAYGNYVGLCQLGRFVANELGIGLARVTCYAGIAELDLGKKEINPVLGAIDKATRQEKEE